ncbi:cystathionine gamma-synthase [Chlorella sorokiniana]|uniref:plant cystathionine gamma-synthase n=1 Tax=Chlorella sorokiniana TaxID=3076 RepID=A0A2P6TX09_CHLSO|nr:cystathionine gamma-synthase [Chlorella sorokiniana]|eukprot:PRW58599.1 cystathionine gamma-synthase [Chlorella sorokiniana]
MQVQAVAAKPHSAGCRAHYRRRRRRQSAVTAIAAPERPVVPPPEKRIPPPEVHSSESARQQNAMTNVQRLATKAVHSGERHGRPKIHDTCTTPIVTSSTFTFADTAELVEYQEKRQHSWEYGRYGNPTTRVLEEKIAALEGAEDCVVSACGMASATTMLLALVPAGGHIVTTTDCYRRTRQFIQQFLPKMGIGATVIDPSDLGALEDALERYPVSLFFSENPTNPYMRCVDVPRIAQLCHQKGAIVAIDSTFATPVNTQPLALGADLVVHSATKYLGGHNDVLAGALCGREELIWLVRELQKVIGATLDPQAAYLCIRGIKTLALRVKQQNETALTLAQRLEAHPKVRRVYYPGLASHPDHEIAKQQMSGFGGVVSFEIEGDRQKTSQFVDAACLPYMGPSLGGTESLIGQPAVMTYFDLGQAGREAIGIGENLVRYSCGVEDVEDLWADLEQALARI